MSGQYESFTSSKKDLNQDLKCGARTGRYCKSRCVELVVIALLIVGVSILGILYAKKYNNTPID